MEPPRRIRSGTGWQRGRREREWRVRVEAVEYQRYVVVQGGTKSGAADDLGLSPRTLGWWSAHSRAGSLEAKTRGRSLKDSGRLKRNEVIAYLREVGPGVGVGRIRGAFPLMPRCEVLDIARVPSGDSGESTSASTPSSSTGSSGRCRVRCGPWTIRCRRR